jgi:hypothetical protein
MEREQLAAMDGPTALLNIVLGASALACLLWGLRQHAVLRRLQAGLVALLSGRYEHRVTKSPEDHEPVFKTFDQLAVELSAQAKLREASSAPANPSSQLARLCDVLRPPLITIQQFAQQLSETAAAEPANEERLHNLRTHVNGLLSLLESSTNISELCRGLSGLRRGQWPPALLGPAVVLVVDDADSASQQLQNDLREHGVSALIAPGVDAVTVMARTLSPMIMLVNGAQPRGFVWTALAELDRFRIETPAQIWLYAEDSSQESGRFWTPAAVWLWPVGPSNHKWRKWVGRQPRRFAVCGDAELATQVVGRLIAENLAPDPSWRGEPPLLVPGCCTLFSLNESDRPEIACAREYALIVPAETALHQPQRLAEAFAAAIGNRAAPWTQLRVMLVDQIVRQATSDLSPNGATT